MAAASEPTPSEFLERLGIDVLCLIFHPSRIGKTLIRRRSDGRLYRVSHWRLSGVAAFVCLVGMRATTCISRRGRIAGTVSIQQARLIVLREAVKRVMDEQELIESGLLTDDELNKLGIVRREAWTL